MHQDGSLNAFFFCPLLRIQSPSEPETRPQPRRAPRNRPQKQAGRVLIGIWYWYGCLGAASKSRVQEAFRFTALGLVNSYNPTGLYGNKKISRLDQRLETLDYMMAIEKSELTRGQKSICCLESISSKESTMISECIKSTRASRVKLKAFPYFSKLHTGQKYRFICVHKSMHIICHRTENISSRLNCSHRR